VKAGAEPPLLERERDLAAIDSLVARIPDGRPGFVLVTGPAGIGKTSFLEAVAERARGDGLEVLRASGAELERGLAFGGAVQLFEPLLRASADRERRRLLEGAARFGGALLGFGSERLSDSTGDPRFAALHGLYWLCVNLSARAPLALLVDDAHWLDQQSLGWIEYLGRRLERLPVLIVVATRPKDEPSQRLAKVTNDIGGQTIELRPLSGGAVRNLLTGAVDQPAEEEFSEAFEEATGGNPFLVHELLRAVRAEGITPNADGARAVRTLGSDRIARSVLLRLHRLSPPSVELARAIAILGTSRSLSLAARLAELDEATATQALEALSAADLLAPGEELRFEHPLVHASIYGDLAAPTRALRHRQAARLLAETGARVSEVASQLLEAEAVGDPWTVATLRSAAADATAQGAPHVAIAFLERALAEPPSEQAEVLFELGLAAHAALDIPRALEALTKALRETKRVDRAPVALALARVLLHAGPAHEAVRLLRAQLESAAEIGPELRLSLEVEYVLFAGPAPDVLPIAGRFQALKGRSPAELAALSAASSMAATANQAATLAQRALADGTLVRAYDEQPAWFLAPWMLIRADRLEEAASALQEAFDHSRATGSQLGFARSSWLAAELDYRKGELLSAESHLRAAHDIASEGGSQWIRLMAGALLAQVLADRGQLAEAQELVDTLDISMIAPGERLIRTVRYARGYVALLDQRLHHVITEYEHLKGAWRITPAAGSRFATGVSPFVIALAQLGQTADARREAEGELAWAEAWETRRFTGMALRALAHTLESSDCTVALKAAVSALEPTAARLELARALADLGSALRRDNQRVAAREPLRRALDLARRCQADSLADQLRGELRTAGAKPRRDFLTGRDSLTASEARTAQMAATGMTNHQIAQALFLSPGTVEKHLTNVYSKLDITSRQQLVAALGAERQASID
jgi:DNA-binding CsgD family transcriptional regulator